MPFIFGNKTGNNTSTAKKPEEQTASQIKMEKVPVVESTKTAYQQNVSQPVQQQNNWYKGDMPTTSEIYGRIQTISQTDPTLANNAASAFITLQQDKSSPWYNPYMKATNQAVKNLNSFGIDTNMLTDEWFSQNTGWQNYLRYSTTTNGVLAPTKKSSDQEILAYNLYQFQKSMGDTLNAENEWKALQQELAYKAGRKDRNYSDDAIIDSIDWSKYATLRKMKDSLGTPSPIELNRANDFSDDAMRAVIWAARNDGGTGSLIRDMAMNGLGEGNTWTDDPKLDSILNFNDRNTYSPYSAGMTLDEEVGLYFGVYGFNQDTLDKIRATLDPNDETSMKMYQKAVEAEKTTVAAETELADLEKKINKWMGSGKSESFVLGRIDSLLSGSDYKTLKAMDESIQDGSKLVQLTRSVGYKRQDLERAVKEAYAKAREQGSAADLAASGLNQTTGDITSVRAARERDQQTRDALAIFDDDLTPEESSAFSGYSGSQDEAKEVLSAVKDNIGNPNADVKAPAMDDILKKQTGDVTKGYIEQTTGLYKSINDYDDTLLSLDKATETADILRKKLGAKEYAGMKNSLSYETEINGKLYRVTMAPDLSGVSSIEEVVNGEFSASVYDAGDDAAIWDYVRGSDELAAQEESYRIKEQKIQEADSLELTDQDKIDLENLRRADMQIENAKTYIRDNKDQYDKDVAAYKTSLERLQAHTQILKDAGYDTTEIDTATAVMAGLSEFTEYEATAWSQYNPTYAYTEKIANGEDKNKVLKQAETDYTEAAENIKDIDWLQTYINDHNIALPDNVRKNMERRIAKHKRDIQDYEYFKLQWSKNFSDVAAEQRHKEYENRHRKSLLGVSTPFDGMTEEEYFASVASGKYEPGNYSAGSLMMSSQGMANLMTEDEQNTWYYLQAHDEKNGTHLADEYFNFLSDPTYGVLWVRQREKTEEYAEELSSSGVAGFAASNVGAVALSPLAFIASGALHLYNKITGSEMNPYSGLRAFSHFRNKTREQSAEEILKTFGQQDENGDYKETILSKIAQGGYEILTNRADSYMNAATFGWMFGGIGNTVAQSFLGAVPMGITAATDAAASAKEKGASDAQAAWIAGVTFVAETATEAISLDNMKEALKLGDDMSADTFKEFMKKWLTSAGISEAFGESLNDIIENYADEKLMGDLSEHSQTVEQYRLEGYDPTTAEAMARKDEINGVLRTALMSYLSPGLDVFQTAKGKLRYYKGKTIEWNENNPDNKKTIRQIRSEELQKQRETNEAEQKQQEEWNARPVEEMGDIDFNALGEKTGYNQKVAEEFNAQLAERKKQADSAAVDFEILQSAKGKDRSAQEAATSAVLDDARTAESKDESDAAAAMLQDVLGEDRNVNEETQDILMGATVTNSEVPQATIKQGIRYAALGGEQSECRRVMLSDEYQKATPAVKATMLAEAVKVDSKNFDLNNGMRQKVHDYRVARAEAKMVEQGYGQDRIDSAEATAIEKEGVTLEKQRELDKQQKTEKSALEASQRAAVGTDDNLFTTRLNEYRHQAEVTRAKQTELEAAQRREKAAKNKVDKIKQQVKTEIRQQAEQAVAQEDQQRAQEAEQRRIEEEKLAAEQAEHEQARNEEEAAVENEIKTNREQYIRQRLQESGYTGEALENQVRRVMNYADQKSRGEEDTSVRLSEKDGDKFLRKISRMTGISYEMQDLGNPLTNRGKIIDRNHMILNSNLTRGQALVEAALHEVTHGLENTKAYNNYASFVLNAMYGGENTEAYNEAIKQKLAEYAKEFKDLSPEEAQKMARYELVAEYARLNLGKKEFLRGITSTGLAGKFRDVLSNAISMLKGYTLDAEGKAKYQELRKAMKLLNECINERSAHIKESNNGHTGLVQASITGWTDATGLTLEVTDDDSHVYRLFNNGQEIKPGEYKAEMVNGTPVGNLIDMAGKSRIETLTNKLERGKLSEREYNKQLNEIAKTAKQQREYVAQIINMIGQYQDAAMVWELAGSLAFSSLKTNGDPQYSDSYDFGTICTKTQAILNAISQTQVDLGRALTKEEIDGVVYEEVGKGVQDKNGKWIHGATPCPPCYVYATWVNKPARLEKVRLYQQECANWTNEQINEFMNRPDPEGRTKTEAKELKTEQNAQKLWISLCLADEVTDPKTGEKTWVRKENPDICPNEILLDLRRSGDMAIQHPGTWTFMQKGGNAQGKAIAPYSDARLGESIVAKAIGAGEANAQLLEDERKSGDSGYIPQFLNPFLSADPNDQEQAEKYFKNALQKIKAQNLKGGQRWQSWSDFRAEWGSDYLMEMITMQALGSQVQTYTKVVEALDLLASAGFEVNMSLMPHGDGFWHNEDGSIKVDEDGNLMLRFSNVTGINPEAAEAYARKYGEKGNVQPMVVGISDEHIKAALAGNYITFVIPFHGSGGSVQRLQHLMSLLHEQMESGNDYTKAQSDDFEDYITIGEGKTKQKINVNPNWALRERILTGDLQNADDETIDAINANSFLKKLYEDRYINEDSDAFGVFFSKGEAQQIYPYEYWDTKTTLATADKNSQRFIDYCQMLGVIPRFSGLEKTVGKGKKAYKVEYANFSGRKVDENGNVTYEPVKGYWKLLIDRSMYNRVYDENGKIIPEKCTYHKPQAVSTADINIGAMPQAANNTVGHSDDDTRQITERIIQRLEMTSGQNEAAGSAVDLEQNAEAINKAINEESGIQNPEIAEQKSQLGDLSKDEMDQLLVDAGIVTAQELQRLNRTDRGEGERQFNTVTGPKSDVFDERAMQYIQNHNRYIQDTNSAELARAIKWITDKSTDDDPDGYQHALTTVTDSSFNYRSKDGQARMIAMMGMAAARGDVHAQVELLRDYGRQGTTLGQALQARKLFTLMTPQGRMLAMERMLNNAQNEINRKGTDIQLAFADWVYQAAANAQSEEDFDRVRQAAINELAQQIPANWKDRVRSLRMLSMLANPRTHIRNIIGNAMFMPAVSMKNKLGALMELGKPQGERTKTLALRLSDDIRQFTRQDADSIKGLLTGEAKFSEATQIRKAQTKLGTALDWLSDLNSKALEAEDWWFLKPHYARALGGWMQANGYTVDQMKSNPELLEKGREYAINEAQKATYRDFNKVSQILNNASREGGLVGFAVDAILPFKKTPANILRRGVEYSPAGIVKSLTTDLYHLKQYQDYQNGKLNEMPEKAISPNQFIDHLCAGLSGTAIMTLGFLLAGTGAVSAGLGDDDDEFEKAKGAQKYSINPGKALNNLFHMKLFGEDVTYTMDWAAPMSMPFFVGAAIRDQMEDGGDLDINEIVNAFGNITEPVFNLSMLDGVNTLFKTSQYDDTNTLTQIGAKVLTNYATSYVPSVLGATARTFFDDKTRKAYVESGKGTGIMGTLRYAIEQTQNKIPILNRQNIAARDIWGNEKTSSFVERLFENFISPGYIEHYEEDPIINEMSRLYEKTGSKDMLLKPDPAKSFSFTSGGQKYEYKLTDKQWDQYKASRNGAAYVLLSELLNSSDYQNANDNVKVQMIDNVWDYADKVGKKSVAAEYELKDYGENAVSEISRDSKISGYKNEIIKALDAGDYDAYETMLEAIRGEYEEEKDADSTVKTKIGDTYRDKWKKAYRDNDYATMSEIEDILDSSGFDFNIYGKGGWQEKEDEKNGY